MTESDSKTMNRRDNPKGVDMDGKKMTAGRLWWIVGGLVCVAVVATILPRIAETQQAELGLSQPPLITIVFDTSSSMQWTEKGEGQYPVWDPDDEFDDNVLPYPDRHLDTWQSGERLGFSVSREYTDEGLTKTVDGDNSYFHSSGDNRWRRTVGPCMVWHPAHEEGDKDWEHEHCDDYTRPPPAPCGAEDADGDEFDCEDIYADAHPGDWYSDMEDPALQHMYDTPEMRLTDGNAPRHVQVKQILAGDMYLNGTSAPGCWFVPRFRGASREEQICCEFVDDEGNCCMEDDDICSDDPEDDDRIFDRYIDYDDPIPHYQEVYDTQLNNGVLDAMGSTAIFSTVAFDGYRDDGTNRGLWEYPTTDIVADESVYEEGDIEWWSDYNDPCGNEDDEECHDMGFFRFVGPKGMNLADDELMQVSRYVQQAILDIGFLEHYPDDDDYYRTLTDEAAGGTPVYDYPLGRQPIAQASPFGPVFHDLHQFYMHGQYDMGAYNTEDDAPFLGAHRTNTGDAEVEEVNPFDFDENNEYRDPYLACRGRHAVIFTDGIAEPEAPGGGGDDLGAGILKGGAFGYLPEKFPYMPAEDAIHEMLEAVIGQMEEASATGRVEDERHLPRVHVLGVGVTGEEGDENLRERVIDKLAAMAEKGRTCAQYYLPPEIVPEGVDTGHRDDNDNRISGDCKPDQGELCLVPQNRDGYTFEAPDAEYDTSDEDNEFECKHPAVVLTHDDRDALREAFQLIFNEIAGMSGLAAQTRPSITNYVDRASGEVGQYRLYSGLQVAGDNPHWKGLLNRQFLECGTDGHVDTDLGGVRLLHEDLIRLRGETTNTDLEELADGHADGDRRRVFTSIPKFINEYIDEDDPGVMKLDNLGGTSVDDSLYSSSYHLWPAVTGSTQNDTFGDGYDITGVDEDDFVQEATRLPFDRLSLTDMFTVELGMDEEDEFLDYWRVDDQGELRETIEDYRGRTHYRGDRMLGGIRYSNPITVGPPALDLPIDSYRRFQRNYSNRTTMTYVTTLDGQLRAIHTGEPDTILVQSDVNADSDYAVDEGGENDDGDAEEQREAWAYIPQLLHRNLSSFAGGTAPDALMDGSPVVQDIRLCTRGESFSANQRACPEGGPASQWRTVLVQGLGQAGPGYFALDITRPGFNDRTAMPDPIVLWEFGPDWEAMQIHEIGDDNSWRYNNVDADDECVDDLSSEPTVGDEDIDSMWELSAMGASVAEPAIGMVNLEMAGEGVVQRPVAVLGGGNPANVDARDPFSDRLLSDCTEHITGRAIYVVDLQSGQLLRRFVGIDGEGEAFASPITGTPVMSAGSPAEVSTRAFVGDNQGRMYRIDFSNPDPEQWKVNDFYDPWENDGDDISDFDATEDELGPADFKPALAMNNNREVVVVYGLGRRGDAGATNTVQAVISVKESFTYDDEDETWEVDSEVLWTETLEGAADDGGEPEERVERLTGEPVIFNNDAYFTTYSEFREDRCAAGNSRIYRLRFDEGDGDGDALGQWTEEEVEKSLDESQIEVGGEDKYIQPHESMLIRGMAITMGPDCSRSGGDALGRPVQQQPQLVAQTSGGTIDSADEAEAGMGGGEVGGIGSIAVGIEIPDTQSIPLSWTVLEQ